MQTFAVTNIPICVKTRIDNWPFGHCVKMRQINSTLISFINALCSNRHLSAKKIGFNRVFYVKTISFNAIFGRSVPAHEKKNEGDLGRDQNIDGTNKGKYSY